jgi:hypothetical protein
VLDKEAVARGPAHVTYLLVRIHSLSFTIDKLVNCFEHAEPHSSHVHNSTPPLAIQNRMYLFHVYNMSHYFV